MKYEIKRKRGHGNIQVMIAGVVFSITSNRPVETISLTQAYRDFRSSGEPEVFIYADCDDLPQIPLKEEDKVFDSEMVWSLYRVDGKNVFALRSPIYGVQPYRLAVFDADFRHGEVYCASPETAGNQLPNPLDFPLSEVLMVCLLAKGRGLMVHACGIEDGGKGYLFAGNSTHGKTTMAQLWKDRSTILNDDRIMLRKREGRFWMYGTPWHGDYSGVSPRGVPLEKVFFLQHAKANTVRRLEGTAAASGLLTRCFPPLWDAEGMHFTLKFSTQLAADVPIHELDFVPDEGVVDVVRCAQ